MAKDDAQARKTGIPDLRPTITVPPGVSLMGPDPAADAEMLLALGAVIRAASVADYDLRVLYCALVDSPYAAITAGGAMTSSLLKECRAVMDARPDLAEEQKSELATLLSRVESLASRRNRFVHDVWVNSRASETETMRSKRGTHNLSFTPVSLSDLIEVARDFRHAGFEIDDWILRVLGPAAAGREAQLRYYESQQRISTDDT